MHYIIPVSGLMSSAGSENVQFEKYHDGGERTGGYQVSECQTQSLRNFRLRSVRLTGREMENKIWVERRRHRRDSRQHTQLIITQSMQAPISASAQKNFTFHFIIVDFKKIKKIKDYFLK